MKNLKEYLAEGKKTYGFVVKFAVKPTNEQVAAMETWLKRYDLSEFTEPTHLVSDHLDFIDIPNKEVHMMRVVLGMPISQYILLQDLRSVINLAEKLMVVRSDNEPVERYAHLDALERQIDAKAKADGEVQAARLSTDREYLKAEQPGANNLFGDEYNRKLLSYLAGVKDTRPTMHVDPPAPLFSWIQMEDVAPGEPHQDLSDFNAHIGGVKPATSGGDDPPIQEKNTTNTGTMSDDTVPTVKFLKNAKTGKARQEVLKPGDID